MVVSSCGLFSAEDIIIRVSQPLNWVMPIRLIVWLIDLTQEGGYQAASQLLQLAHPPTAIMAINDLTALGVYQAVQQKGWVVGRDIAVTGYDGFQEAEFASPPLTTAFQPTYEIARQLTKMLQAVINKQPLDTRVVEFSSEISIRSSSDYKLQA